MSNVYAEGQLLVDYGGTTLLASLPSKTDSVEYREGKVKRTRDEGSEKDPESQCLRSVGACMSRDSVPFA